ncbi:hypothetical protein [Rhodococcus sp. OK302]|uniref:hypothetical protein n=1 Tax=Rhodococcus sp. OK302 TaxID=1882769 RepID=UPI000B93E441|nr:hypothetical protein [Rhodococcus sp. OK302]OYD70234.1 hypothetical protein BDB13_3832 [Rhodococcus sp. OK302]
MDFDSAADDLYGLEPSEFVAARNAWVMRAKEAGDKPLVKELGSLRKPTTTGWALNLLARAEPENLDRLLDLGAALRSAQQALRGDELRSLTTRRAALLSELTDSAVAAAKDRGHLLPETVLREIGQTLSAALADPDIGDDLRRGRMLGGVSYSGFGPAALASVPEPPTPTEDTIRGADEQARGEAHSRVTDAETTVRQTNSELNGAIERAEKATRRVEELRDELSRAETESRFADAARRSAEQAAEGATAELAQARHLAAEFDA